MHACPVKSVFSLLPSGSLNKSIEHGPFTAELSRFSYQIWADPLMADGFLQRRNDQPTVHGFKAPLTPLYNCSVHIITVVNPSYFLFVKLLFAEESHVA
jgi:hypothetical protein